jgi:RNAse (barnase) inhibitor barstar
MIKVVEIPTNDIVDWESFHIVFKEALAFPDFYGRNGDAFIDCLTYDDDGMSIVLPPPGGLLAIKLKDCVDFFGRCTTQFEALVAWIAAVNDRRMETGDSLVAIIPEDYASSDDLTTDP